MTTEHLADDAMHDLADATLPAAERAAAEAHLAQCGGCRARLERVRALLRGAGELPRAVEPEADLWPGIRAAIERRQVVPLAAGPVAGPAAAPARRPAWWRVPAARLAAAGLLLAALSSGATALFMMWRAGDREPRVAAADTPAVRGTPAPGLAPSGVAIDFVRQEENYRRLARELEAAVAAHRDSLSPETVATVERSVRVIDAAIAEARAALEREPENRALVELLKASYQQKLDLLRRTSQIVAGA